MKLSLGVDPDAEVDYVEIADQEEEAEEDEEEEVSDGEEEEVDGGEEVASDEIEAIPEASTEEAPTVSYLIAAPRCSEMLHASHFLY